MIPEKAQGKVNEGTVVATGPGITKVQIWGCGTTGAMQVHVRAVGNCIQKPASQYNAVLRCAMLLRSFLNAHNDTWIEQNSYFGACYVHHGDAH